MKRWIFILLWTVAFYLIFYAIRDLTLTYLRMAGDLFEFDPERDILAKLLIYLPRAGALFGFVLAYNERLPGTFDLKKMLRDYRPMSSSNEIGLEPSEACNAEKPSGDERTL